jgi:hypothetical protein
MAELAFKALNQLFFVWQNFAMLRGKRIENNILCQIPLFWGKNHPKKFQKITQNCHLLTTGKGP